MGGRYRNRDVAPEGVGTVWGDQVVPSALTFVTVSAVVKLWGRIRGGWSEYAC